MSYNEQAVRERPAAYTASAEHEARAFVEEHTATLAPLLRESHLASWNAAVGEGDDAEERSARARAAVKHLYADPERAARVRAWLASGQVRDPLLRRQLVLLDLEYTGSQLPEESIEDLVRRSASLEQTFGAPVVLLGFGLPGENAHAPNEWMSEDNFYRGAEAIAILYDEL